MSRKTQPDDVFASMKVPGDLYRKMKAACAHEGITIRDKLNELLAREYSDAPVETIKRRRRQPSQLAPMQGAEQ